MLPTRPEDASFFPTPPPPTLGKPRFITRDSLPLPAELLEAVDSWSADCVALWLENLGFGTHCSHAHGPRPQSTPIVEHGRPLPSHPTSPASLLLSAPSPLPTRPVAPSRVAADLRTAFTGNKVDGPALKLLTMDKLAEDYGVSDEDNRKKIFYNLKDVLRKDNSSGNTNHFQQMLMWCLPFLAIYKWLTLKYDKQIAKLTKKYKKWQEAKNPPKAPEPVIDSNGNDEWISGMNSDTSTGKSKKKEKAKKTPKAD